MKTGRWVYNQSSTFTALPVLLGALLLCAICVIFGVNGGAVAFMLLFVLGGLSRLWADLALRRVSLSVTGGSDGVFPGQIMEFTVQIKNDKLLPLIWLELFFPLSRSLCMRPEQVRRPGDWELPLLRAEGFSEELVGEKQLSFCLWYETMTLVLPWRAERRGLYSTAGWRLRSGDGLGLTQSEQRIRETDASCFAVYPARIPVLSGVFLRHFWNADTGSWGVRKDPSLLRSVRDYEPGDNIRQINWRLLARGLPLSVNVYEDILPRSIHFLLDGESFGGPEPHREELEETLSILASELLELTQAQAKCGLSLCAGEGVAVHHTAGTEPVRALLRSLAAYEPAPPQKDEKNQIVRQKARFEQLPLTEGATGVGRFYYFCYDVKGLQEQPVLRLLGPEVLSVISWVREERLGDFEILCLQELKQRGEK